MDNSSKNWIISWIVYGIFWRKRLRFFPYIFKKILLEKKIIKQLNDLRLNAVLPKTTL
jgi:hypothetical protein